MLSSLSSCLILTHPPSIVLLLLCSQQYPQQCPSHLVLTSFQSTVFAFQGIRLVLFELGLILLRSWH